MELEWNGSCFRRWQRLQLKHSELKLLFFPSRSEMIPSKDKELSLDPGQFVAHDIESKQLRRKPHLTKAKGS